jgi:hypothetical protein
MKSKKTNVMGHVAAVENAYILRAKSERLKTNEFSWKIPYHGAYPARILDAARPFISE